MLERDHASRNKPDDFLTRAWERLVPDRPGRIFSKYNYQFSPGISGHPRVARWGMNRGTNCGAQLRLLSSHAHDDVVTHVAAIGGDTRRLRYVQPRRSTLDR
jgi:hypothetical protein